MNEKCIRCPFWNDSAHEFKRLCRCKESSMYKKKTLSWSSCEVKDSYIKKYRKEKDIRLEKEYQKIMVQFESGDKADALVKFSRLGNCKRYGKALNFIGDCHMTGDELVKNKHYAYSAYHRAVERGYLPAFYQCGKYNEEMWFNNLFENDYNANQCFEPIEDKKDAMSDYYRLAKRNHAPSQFRLAQLYVSYPNYDLRKAEVWYKRAIKNGFAPAQESLAWCYANIDIFNDIGNGSNTEDAAQSIIKEGECMEIGKKLLRKPEEVIILNGCQCHPDIKCYFCNDGRYYKNMFNSFECADRMECFKFGINRRKIIDIKVRSENFPCNQWEYV